MKWWVAIITLMVAIYCIVVVGLAIVEERKNSEYRGNIEYAMAKLRELNSTLTMMIMEIEWVQNRSVVL